VLRSGDAARISSSSAEHSPSRLEGEETRGGLVVSQGRFGCISLLGFTRAIGPPSGIPSGVHPSGRFWGDMQWLARGLGHITWSTN